MEKRTSRRGPKPTSGRRDDPSVLVSVRVPSSVKAVLDRGAEEAGQKLSAFLRDLLTRAAAQLDEVEASGQELPQPTEDEEAQTPSAPAATKQGRELEDEVEEDWRRELFGAYEGAEERRNGNMIPEAKLAARLTWSASSFAERLSMGRREGWVVVGRPLPGVDDTTRVKVLSPPEGAALRQAQTRGELREWLQSTRDAAQLTGIPSERLRSLADGSGCPATWERARLEVHAHIYRDEWPEQAPGGAWTRKRAHAALRKALPASKADRAALARSIGVREETLTRWGRSPNPPRPQDRYHAALEQLLFIPASAWR